MYIVMIVDIYLIDEQLKIITTTVSSLQMINRSMITRNDSTVWTIDNNVTSLTEGEEEMLLVTSLGAITTNVFHQLLIQICMLSIVINLL